MGRLTDEMARLRDEIGNLRSERKTFLKDLATAVLEMRAGFRVAHSEMASKLRAQLREVQAELAGARSAWFGKRAFRPGR